MFSQRLLFPFFSEKVRHWLVDISESSRDIQHPTSRDNIICSEDEEDHIFFVRNIADGAKMLKAWPNTIVELKVTFHEEMDRNTRHMLTAEMADSCENVTYLHVVRFTDDNFLASAFARDQIPYHFNDIFPNLRHFILEASNIPLKEIASLQCEHLSLIHMPTDFLASSHSKPVVLPMMKYLVLEFDIIPAGYNFGLNFPICMNSVKELYISHSSHSKIPVHDFLAFSERWPNVHKLEMDIHGAFTIENIRALVGKMPKLTTIHGMIIHRSVTFKGLEDFMCNEVRIVEFKIKGRRFVNTIQGFGGFVQNLSEQCGVKIVYPKNPQEQPYFKRQITSI